MCTGWRSVCLIVHSLLQFRFAFSDHVVDAGTLRIQAEKMGKTLRLHLCVVRLLVASASPPTYDAGRQWLTYRHFILISVSVLDNRREGNFCVH